MLNETRDGILVGKMLAGLKSLIAAIVLCADNLPLAWTTESAGYQQIGQFWFDNFRIAPFHEQVVARVNLNFTVCHSYLKYSCV